MTILRPRNRLVVPRNRALVYPGRPGWDEPPRPRVRSGWWERLLSGRSGVTQQDPGCCCGGTYNCNGCNVPTTVTLSWSLAPGWGIGGVRCTASPTSGTSSLSCGAGVCGSCGLLFACVGPLDSCIGGGLTGTEIWARWDFNCFNHSLNYTFYCCISGGLNCDSSGNPCACQSGCAIVSGTYTISSFTCSPLMAVLNAGNPFNSLIITP